MSVASEQQDNYFAVSLASAGAFLNSYCLTNVFPYSASMVLHFDLVNDINEAGYYAGLLASSFMFARIFTSFLWGQISDDYGRRVVFLISTFSSTVLPLIFGFATTLKTAIVARALMGFFGGHVSVAKTVVSESVSPKSQNKALGYFMGISNLGAVVGPSVGGWFSFTGTNADLEKSSVFLFWQSVLDPLGVDLKLYPFLVPNIIGAVISLIVFLGGYFFLPETGHHRVLSSEAEQENEAFLEKGEVTPEERATTVWKYVLPFTDIVKQLDTAEKRTACLIYGFYSFIHLSFTEVLPLWFQASLDRKGFGLSLNQTGMILSISSLSLFLFVMLLFPLFSSKIEPTALILCCLSFVFCYFLLSPDLTQLLVSIDGNYTIFFLTLMTSIWLCLNTCVYVSSNAMVNNSCHISERGSMNGLVLTFGSVTKTLGPIIGAEIFAWSINNEWEYPFEYHLSFYFFAILSLLLTWYTRSLPEKLNVAKNG